LIIVHYKYRVPPNLYELGDNNFFSLASLANSLFCTPPHYGTRGAAPARRMVSQRQLGFLLITKWLENT